MEVAEVSGSFGAEVRGVDLAAPSTVHDAAVLRRLFLEHSMLLFRDQHLSQGDQRSFIGALGPLSDALLPRGEDGGAFYLSNETADGRGELAPHSDHCFLDAPLWGISLYAEAVPASGGETVFISAVAAGRNLTAELRSRVSGREAEHTYVARDRLGDDLRDPSLPPSLTARHPVLWDHPVTGVPVLYINPWMTRAIVGVEPEESAMLISALSAYLDDPAISYRHQWRSGDFLVWDNIALLHARTSYDPKETRRLHRLQLGLP